MQFSANACSITIPVASSSGSSSSTLSEDELLLSQAIEDQCACPLPRDEDDDRYIASFPPPSSSIRNTAAKEFFEEYGFVVFRDIFGAQG